MSMVFEEHTPDLPIKNYIESIFHYQDFVPGHSIERVVPTGHIFLIFELDGIPRTIFDNETQEPIQTCTKVWISGMHTGQLTISSHKDAEMLVAQFKPAGVYPFFHKPISQLNDQVISANKVLGNEIHFLRTDILRKKTAQEKMKAVELYLRQRFDETKTPPDELMKVIRLLQDEPVSRLSEIVEAYPNTQKHLISEFKKYVGLTPKVFQRILRFNEILKKISNKERIAWAEIAYECGYSDQSHFIKEFSHFSGFNPQEFIDRDFNNTEPNFFPLD